MPGFEMRRRGFLTAAGAAAAGWSFWPARLIAASGDVVRFRSEGDIQIIDPAFEVGGMEEAVIRAIFVSLVEVGDVREGSKLKMSAAESMEQLDPLAIRFRLRPGLKWSGDFGPVTAEDVKYSFERVADPKMESPWAYQFEKLDQVEVVDERTGIIRLKEPYQPFWFTSLPWYGGHVVCKAAVEKAGGKFTTEPPATCGAYRIERWEPKQKLTLVANPDWPGPPVDFKTVEFLIVEDDEAAALAYEAGSFDYTRVSVASGERYRQDLPPETKLLQGQSSAYVWLTVNVEHPSLADPRVRQALQYAVDVEQILIGAYNGLVPRSTGVVQPGTWAARERNLIEKADYDKAKALLAEAGVSDPRFTMSVLNNTTDMSIAQIIQASAGQAGITIEIVPYDEGVYWTLGDQSAGETWKEQQLVLMRFNGGLDPAENLVWFRPEQIGVYNWSRWNSAEFEELYQQGLRETEEAKRKVIYNKMEDLMEQSGGFIFITHEPLLALYRANIEPVVLVDNQLVVAGTRKVG